MIFASQSGCQNDVNSLEYIKSAINLTIQACLFDNRTMLNSGQQDPDHVLELLAGVPELIPVAAEILDFAVSSDAPEHFLAGALQTIASATGVDYSAVVAAQAGHWGAVSETGTRSSLPFDLLADVLDREVAVTDGPWIAVPLAPRSGSSELLLLYATGSKPGTAGQYAEHLAPVVHQALSAVRRRQNRERRIRRLETILEIANQWNRTLEVEPLLGQMAEAATRLLQADRASIFLWDRANHVLVGRPALGIEDGELRVPDDRGVVGQVVQTGEPARADAVADPDAVDHDVDARLKYQTRTVLCVPLRSAAGKLLGVFEILNKREGSFTDADQEALIELAGHAAIPLENARDRQRLLSTNRQITDQAAQRVQIIGNSPAIEALRSIIGRVADTDLAVLLLGENGTGKEVIAQSIHYTSRRRDQPFVAVNCAAIPDTLAESELFGHEKGAFTDAREARAGKFELAAAGTLFLDEIGELSSACQAKLLRVLEEKVLVRVGGSAPIHSDARVLAATNQDLPAMVREKRFREDLYFRLNVVTLELPALRDRGSDVLLLADHFLTQFCGQAHRDVPLLTAAARRRLQDHPWPGNVRELRNLMERLAFLSTGDSIDAEDLAFVFSPRADTPFQSDAQGTLSDATSQFQVQYIRQAIQQSAGSVSRAAERLGLHRSNLYRKMRQLGMNPPL